MGAEAGRKKGGGRQTIAREHIGIAPSCYPIRLVFGRFIRSKASQVEGWGS